MATSHSTACVRCAVPFAALTPAPSSNSKYCPACLKAKRHEDYLRNKAHVLEKSRQWRLANKERKAQNDRAYRQANRDKVNAALRARRKRPDACESHKRACARYEKSKPGFLMRLYRNMQSRVTGVQKLKHHLYAGKELLLREDFYRWANESPRFHALFAEWEASGYERRLSPSVDRVNSERGYTIDNMEWVPFHENCRRSTYAKHGKARAKPLTRQLELAI